MKTVIFVSLLISALGFARDVDLSEFNKKLHQNMDSVLEQNPQMYEKKSFGRKPASISPVKNPEGITEKLDEFDEQANGHQSF